jgi:hypothetical protein
MIRQISYIVAFCLVSIITASNLKAAERDGTSGYGGNQSKIGFATVAVNVVKGTIETDTRNIMVSNHVFQQELIETNSVSTTQFVFLDETVLIIGPDSRLILDEMVFNSNATKGKVVMTAVRGLFTFVSGTLPSKSYQMRTPTSTIGVRGTKFDLFVARNGASTVILRSGAINVRNLKGVVRRITTTGLATRVVTKNSIPTPPAPPIPQLEQLFKPLADPGQLQGKNPQKVNAEREDVETESDRKNQIELRREKPEDLKKAEDLKRNKGENESDRKNQIELRREKAEDLKQKRGKRVGKIKTKKGKISVKRASAGATQAGKKASGGATQAAKQASRGATQAAKQASRGATQAAKKASRGAIQAAMKASRGATQAAKQASRGATQAAKKASRGAIQAAMKASRSAKRVRRIVVQKRRPSKTNPSNPQ